MKTTRSLTPQELKAVRASIDRKVALVRAEIESLKSRQSSPTPTPKPSPITPPAPPKDAKTAEPARPSGFIMTPAKLARPHQELTLLAQSVFQRLQSFCSEKRLKSHPEVNVSQKTLCAAVGYGETKVRAALAELERAGWIDVVRQGCHRVNHYRLYEAPLADRDAKAHLERTKRRIDKDPALRARLTKGLYPKKENA
jgi:hypothetical protein